MPDQPSGSSASSGSEKPKGLKLKVEPYVVCPCAGEPKVVTATATATGPGAATAVVVITGPHNTSADGTGGATLTYSTREEDRGTELTFTATATERPDQTGKAYVLKAVFRSLAIRDGSVAAIQDPDNPNKVLLTVDTPGAGGAGILMHAEFEVVPFVPDPDAPEKSFLTACPMVYTIGQWIKGWQAAFLKNQPPPADIFFNDKLEDVGITEEVWISQTQTMLFTAGDLIGPSTDAPPIQILLMAIDAIANVYLQTACADCEHYETIGKGSWTLNGTWAPSPPPPNPPIDPAIGSFDGTDGVASNETPRRP